ncbi:hypothetical protein TraAM80_05882 [Trypanosoma rangeli]|uniref:Uncharacterized protein n=1 Tax=Trypanosoma rangeli TaxID=5698 RepID=A0A422NCN8_TRYRA|nr:uncharacterized protein TraAM80_05882 [Trypanosoma rangeli]RNF03202.1 hypothetical protein TraAM80_05882 [Trypanosoma rangeli]|eukprot:RNF03202.1 hypothetical protein TraAM80_05882 [Trypanosoma rangeli]
MPVAGGFLFSLREALMWSVVFALCGAAVGDVHSALSTLAFGLIVSLTIPMKLMDIHHMLLADVNGKSSVVKFFKKRDGNARKAKETFLLLTAIVLGASITQPDWHEWFQAWPYPVVTSFALMRAALLLFGLRRKV